MSMTVDQIKAAIAADSALQALADARDVDALVTALSAGRTRYVAREVGNGTVLEVLGLSVGNALLDLIQAQHADALASLAQVPDPVDRTAVWVAITDGRLE